MYQEENLPRLLEDIVGREHVTEVTAAQSDYGVDGLRPAMVVVPGDRQQISEVIQAAGKANAGIISWGGGTMMGRGQIPSAYDIALALGRVREIVDFDVPNLTVTAQAGLPLSQLQENLAEERQFLPLDPFWPERATVGGTVAANASGPSRLRYGAARDLVLGMRVVLATGEMIHVGGKTVKNVAGYDLTKMFIGSYGSLGIITEVTFRLLPQPQHKRALRIAFATLGDAQKFAARILDSELLPTTLSILNGPGSKAITGAGPDTCAVVMGIEGSPETVERQVKQMAAMAGSAGASSIHALDGSEVDLLLTAVRDFAPAAWQAHPEGMALTANLPISRTAEVVSEWERSAEEQGLTVSCVIGAGVGTVHGQTTAAATSQLVELYNRMVAAAERLGGHCTLDRAAPQVKEQVQVWSTPREEWQLAKALKQKFDPRGLFNRGRFVGGI
jgi:glycolate oxidase FAD binding subunit